MTVQRAGWAEIDITPPLGLPMGGRGQRFTPGASVLDPLLAQAVALEDARGNRTLWVSVDLIGFPGELAAALLYDLSALTGVPYEAIVLNQAHPHSGPMTGFRKYPSTIPMPPELQAYEDVLRRAIPRLGCEAVRAMRPAVLSLHRGASHVGINRRNRNAQGVTVMAPNPAGVYNPDLWVYDITAREGGGRCVLFNYGCHPVIVYGYAWDGISADYPGECRRRLRAALGADTHCQFIQGLAGDVRPRVLADLDAHRFRKATPADLETAGAELAGDVLDALRSPGETLELEIAAAAGWFMAQRDVSQHPSLAAWIELSKSEDEVERNSGLYWTARTQAGLPPARAVPFPVGLIQLAPGRRIAWLGGEAVAEWQAHLRCWLADERLADERLMVWGYCQEVSAYLPTDELLPEGGYEVVDSNRYTTTGPGPFVAGLNAAVRERFLGLQRQIGG
ncbi:MAG: hypothetical protein JXA09_08415 [Anaerolineae bacterium]|nr:hypothetical protein [Anaerolineae bacterium]